MLPINDFKYKYEIPSSTDQPVIHKLIPLEIIKKILSYLLEKDTISNLLVCKEWKVLFMNHWQQTFYLAPLNKVAVFLLNNLTNEIYKKNTSDIQQHMVKQIDACKTSASLKRFYTEAKDQLMDVMGNLDDQELNNFKDKWVAEKIKPKDFKHLFFLSKQVTALKAGKMNCQEVCRNLLTEVERPQVITAEDYFLVDETIKVINMLPNSPHVASQYTLDDKQTNMFKLFQCLFESKQLQKGLDFFLNKYAVYIQTFRDAPVASIDIQISLIQGADILKKFFQNSSIQKTSEEVSVLESYCQLLVEEYGQIATAINIASEIDIGTYRIKAWEAICKSIVKKNNFQDFDKAITTLRANIGNIDRDLYDIAMTLANIGQYIKALEFAALISDKAVGKKLSELIYQLQ